MHMLRFEEQVSALRQSFSPSTRELVPSIPVTRLLACRAPRQRTRKAAPASLEGKQGMEEGEEHGAKVRKRERFVVLVYNSPCVIMRAMARAL